LQQPQFDVPKPKKRLKPLEMVLLGLCAFSFCCCTGIAAIVQMAPGKTAEQLADEKAEKDKADAREKDRKAEIKRRDQEARDRVNAYVVAQMGVENRLKSPGTAKFVGSSQDAIYEKTAKGYKIAGEVDAQNGFGALVRSVWVAEVEREGAVWVCTDVQIATRQ
jgi:hypothetical protein